VKKEEARTSSSAGIDLGGENPKRPREDSGGGQSTLMVREEHEKGLSTSSEMILKKKLGDAQGHKCWIESQNLVWGAGHRG